MEGKRAGEEAEAAGRPEMQEAAGERGEALCLSCFLGPSVHPVQFLGIYRLTGATQLDLNIGWILTARFQIIGEGSRAQQGLLLCM